MARPDIEVLVGVLGGGSIGQGSGREIATKLSVIMNHINDRGVAKVKLHVDNAYFRRQVENAVKNIPQLSVDVGVNIAPLSGSRSSMIDTKDLRNKVEQARAQIERTIGQMYSVSPSSKEGQALRARLNNLLSQEADARAELAKETGKTEKAIFESAIGSDRAIKATEQRQKQYKTAIDKYEQQKERLEKLRGDAVAARDQLDRIDHQHLGDIDVDDKKQEINTIISDIDSKLAEPFNSSRSADQLSDFVSYNDQMQSAMRQTTQAVEDATKRQTAARNLGLLNQDKTAQKAVRIAKKHLEQMQKAPAVNQSTIPILEKAIRQVENGSTSFEEFTKECKRAGLALDKTGSRAGTLGKRIEQMLETRIGYAVITAGIRLIADGIKSIYKNVVDLDTAMTELKKVTSETDATYRKFLDDAGARAQKLGATLTDVVTATADFARLGFSLDEASGLADAAIIYKNVGDGISDISTASESIISTMKGFGMEASEAMAIVDRFNEVGNNFAITSKGIGDALVRSAAAMDSAGNNIDETIALITAANTVLQNPDTVGTTLKTVSMYLRAAKTDIEAAGESTEGMANSVSELRDSLMTLTGGKVDIQIDPTTYKNTYQILQEISNVWDELEDVDQANILEMLGGKRNANAVAAIIENFSIAEEALVSSMNSAGSATKENEKYLESIAGKLSQLSAAWQTFSGNVLNSDLVKVAVDFLRTMLELFNRVDAATSGVSTSLLALLAAFGGIAGVVAAFKSDLGGVAKFVSVLGDTFGGLKDVVLAAAASMGLHTTATAAAATVNTSATASTLAFTGALKKLKGAILGVFTGHPIAAPIIATLAVAIPLLVAWGKAIDKQMNPSVDELQSRVDDTTSEIEGLNSEMMKSADRIAELRKLAENGDISFTEADELKRLEQQNTLLQKQIDLKETILKEDKKRLSDASYKSLYHKESIDTIDEYGNASILFKTKFDYVDDELIAYENAKKKYMEALEGGDDKAAARYKASMDQLNVSLNEQISELLNLSSSLDLTKKEHIDASAAVDAAYAKYIMATGDATAAHDAFNILWNSAKFADARIAIEGLATAGETTAASLMHLAETNPLVQELLNLLANLGIIDPSHLTEFMNQFGVAVSVASSKIVSLKEVTEHLKGPMDIFNKAIKETSGVGYVSTDTLQELTSKYPKLEKHLIKTANGYQMTLNGLKDYLELQRIEYTTALTDAQAAAIKICEAEGLKADGYEKTTLRIKEQLLAQQALAIKIANDERYKLSEIWGTDNIGRQLINANKTDLLKEKEAEIANISNVLKDLAIAENNLSTYNAAASGAIVEGIDATSGSSTDKYKQEIEKQIKILKHKREMDLITDKQYYDELDKLQEKYYVNKTKYEEEIWDLEQEIFNGRRELHADWVSDQQKVAERQVLAGDIVNVRGTYQSILDETKKMTDAAIKYGLDENSDYVQELRQQAYDAGKAILDSVNGAYDDFASYADDFNMWDKMDISKLDYLERQLKDIDQCYKDGLVSFKDYIEAHNDIAKQIYDTQKESIETIIDMTMEMIEQEADDHVEALEKEKDAYSDIIDLKKKLLEDTKDEADHEREVAEAVKEIAKLQSKISQLSLDDSREAAAKRAELEEELAEKQKELADLQSDYAYDATVDMLDESQEAFEKEKDEEIKLAEDAVDTWVERYNIAIDRIDNDWENLYEDLEDWMAIHRDSIDGPDSLKTSWENVIAIKERYANMSIEDAYDQLGEVGINPNASQDPEAQKILQQMIDNSIAAKQAGTSIINGVNLHKWNEDLAEEYEDLTGQHLEYNNGWRFDNKNGEFIYDLSGINGPEKPNGSNESASTKWADKNPYTVPSGNNLIQMNSEGDEVKWVQYQLQHTVDGTLPITGQFWKRTYDAVVKFQEKYCKQVDGKVGKETIAQLKKYHTGGIIDRTGAISSNEVLAIMKTGEWALDDGRQMRTKEIFDRIQDTIRLSAAVNSINKIRNSVGTQNTQTFAPHFEVNIQHNGQIGDADAKRYGEQIANEALEKLRTAFNKRGF